jgi:hypothetical protein
MRFLLLTVCIGFSACFEPTVANPGAIDCADSELCPEQLSCQRGRCLPPDTTPPAPILDLAVDVSLTTDRSLTLSFTAPTDEGALGAWSCPRNTGPVV